MNKKFGGTMKKVIMIMMLILFVSTIFAQNVFDEALAVRQGTNIEWFRSSTAINEGVVYVWSDTRDGGRDLFAQLMSSTGEKLWGESGVIVDNNYDRQEDPMVITTSDNAVIIGYVCFADDPDGNIKAQKINSSGDKLWGEFGVPVCSATNVQISVNMVPDANGGTYMAWTDNRESLTQIYAQHINSTGNFSWQTNGINVDATNTKKGSNTFWEDEEGGAVMAYVRYPEQNAGDIYIVRFTQEDEIAWGPIPLIEMENDQSNVKMSPDGNEGFIFAWESKEPTVQLRLQRIDLEGNLLWDENGIALYQPAGDSLFAQERHRIVEVSTGGAIIAWEDKRTPPNTNPDIYVQKIDLNGNPQWQEGGIPVFQSETKQDALRLSKTNDNGAVLVWEDARYNEDSERQIFAQKFNADGTVAWGDGGMIISDTMGGQSGANIKVVGDLYNVVWADQRTGSLALMTQMINEAGDHLLTQNGIEVYWGLSGNAEYFKTVSHNNTTFILWLDTRHGTFGAKMYYQIIDAQGNEVMPHNGARVSLDDEGYIIEQDLNIEINDNGELCIAWARIENTLVVPYVQIINSQGDRLLGDNGMQLKDNASARNTGIFINWRNGGWELFWTENVSTVLSIMGQRLENHQRVWGDSGKLILRVYDEFTLGTNTTVSYAFSDYLIFSFANSQMNNNENYQLLKIDDDGNIAEGWAPFGKPVAYSSAYQSLVKTLINDEKIYVFWAETSTELNLCYYAAIFDLNGEPINEDYVYNLTPFENDQKEAQAIIQDSFLYVSYIDNSNIELGYDKVVLQKYSLEDNAITPLWDGLGEVVLVDEAHHVQPSIVPMYSRILVACQKSLSGLENVERDSAINMNMLNPDGDILGSQEGYVVNNHIKDQIEPIITKNSNTKVSVVWRDGISSGKEPIHGIYMQRVDTPIFTPNGDTVENTPTLFKSLGNYPNPFNPETKIAFNMNYTSNVKIDIYNIKGQKVKTLVNELFEKGNHIVLWNGTNNENTPVSSGLYFYKISTVDHSSTHKMLLLK